MMMMGGAVSALSAPSVVGAPASSSRRCRVVMQSRRVGERQTHPTKTVEHARYWHSGTLVDGFVTNVKSSLQEARVGKQAARQVTSGSATGKGRAKSVDSILNKVIAKDPPRKLALGNTTPGLSTSDDEAAEVLAVTLGLVGGVGFALFAVLLGAMFGFTVFGAGESGAPGEQVGPMINTVGVMYAALMAVMAPLLLLRK